MAIPQPPAGTLPWTTTGEAIIDALNGARSEVVDQCSKIVGRNRRTNSAPSTTSTTQSGAQKIMDTQASLLGGRTYMVFSPGFGIWGPGSSGAIMRGQLTYTTDGSTPGVTSTVLDMAQQDAKSADNVVAMVIGKPYICSSNMTFRCLLSYYLVSSGTAAHYAAADWPTDLIIQDVGLTQSVNGTNF